MSDEESDHEEAVQAEEPEQEAEQPVEEKVKGMNVLALNLIVAQTPENPLQKTGLRKGLSLLAKSADGFSHAYVRFELRGEYELLLGVSGLILCAGR
jgi:hypothetical protein